MTRTIRARFVDGVLKPMEPVSLPPGCEVAITITTPEEPSDQWEQAIGGWAGLIDADAFLAEVYQARDSVRSARGDSR